MSYSALALPAYSFLNRSRSISVGNYGVKPNDYVLFAYRCMYIHVGGPDEDYNGCEIECFNPVTQEHRGKAVVVEQVISNSCL